MRTAKGSLTFGQLRDKEHAELVASLREMLDCYWGEGDGDPPPAFIQRAIDLIGWKHRSRDKAS